MISDPNDESPANVDAAVSDAFFPVIFLIVYWSFVIFGQSNSKY